MFLIDSSVWVEYLHPKGAKKVKEVLFHLLKPVIDIICKIGRLLGIKSTIACNPVSVCGMRAEVFKREIRFDAPWLFLCLFGQPAAHDKTCHN